MNLNFTLRRAGLGAIAISAGLLTSAGYAQDEPVINPQALYTVVPGKPSTAKKSLGQAALSLPTWNGSYTSGGKNYSYNMVGTAPTTNTATTIPIVLIPIKIVIGSSTFDPNTVPSNTNGKTVVANTLASPLFTSTVDFKAGSIDLGKTQYIDAFQRANFWGTVKTDSNYHLLLGTPTVTATQTLKPPSNYGRTGSVFGFTAGLVDINWFDAQINTLMVTLGITANQFPIFLTYDVYLTQNRSCCIGGYHSATGAQSYTHATYVSKVGAFAQDVSALSHEIGEWADDPLTLKPNGNQTPCGILEVGDPLENTSNYGAYPYAANGFSYNLQDLATLPYFGDTASGTANGWLSFHGYPFTRACQNGS